MKRRDYQKMLAKKREQNDNINNRYFILSCALAFLLLLLASFLLDDAFFKNNWAFLRYLVAFASFILSVVFLIAGDQSEVKL